MKQCKKLLCLCLLALSLTLLISLTAPPVAAAEHSGSCGDYLTWSFDPATGVLSFSGSGDMYLYSYTAFNEAPWYELAADIKEINLPEGLTSIGSDAFLECVNVTEIRLPSTLEKIYSSAFSYCTGIRTITIPKNVSLIQDGAFQNMDNLTAIIVDKDNPYFTSDARGVLYTKSMDRLIRCPEIFSGTYTVPAQVKEIDYSAFFSCHGMTEITIPGHISNLDPRSFTYCPDLQKITITGENDDYYTDSQGALYDKHFPALALCPRGYTGRFVIPQGIIEIWDESFYDCVALTDITIPNSVVSISNHAFYGCLALKNIRVPHSVTELGYYTFAECSSLKSITLPAGLSEIPEGLLMGCSSLATIDLPKGLKLIGDDAFNGCSSLATIDLPKGLKLIGDDAFNGCSSLTSLSIPNGVTEIGKNAFEACTSLKEILLPHSLTTIGSGAFSDCQSLRSFNIPDSITEYGLGVLENCNSLEEVYLPSRLDEYICQVFFDAQVDHLYFRGEAPDPLFIGDSLCAPGDTTLHFVYGRKDWTYPTWNKYHTELWHGIVTTDVKERDYFYTPVQWALWHGITNGMGNDLFQPESTCTRGQIVTFLWRAAGCPEPTVKENPFTDVSSKAYYYKAVLWAVEKDITKGMGKGLFAPDGECTRAQVATFLWRYYGKPTATTVSIPFTDVLPNTYYTQAVLWAVEKEITNGMGNNKFAPENPCTRGQIVTFLWRAAGKPDVIPEYVKEPTYRALYHPVVESLIDSLKEKDLYQNYYSAGVLYDLDQNGIEELILLYSLPRDDNSASPHQAVCDVYTVQNEQVVPLMEGHRFGALVGGGQAHAGIAKIDGQTYLYCLNSFFDRSGSEEYEYIEQNYTKWQLFRLDDMSLQAVTTVELDLRYGYKEEYCCPMLLPELSTYTFNGEERPVEDYYTWYESISYMASIGPEWFYEASDRVGFLSEDLINLCF